MIDTISIQTIISKNIYDIVYNNSVIKSSIDASTGQIFYKIVNGYLEGSYSSSLCVRVFENNEGFQLRIEGSFHKLKYGFNSHNGFNNIIYISNMLIALTENYYKIELPQIEFWFVNRIDIALCFDLKNQKNISTYINNLKKCTFPARKVLFYKDESLYCSGSTTTLKIYNKMLEFQKHDMKKFKNTNFDLFSYLHTIQGFLRFEVEIKKRKLLKYYNKEKNIKIIDIKYIDLKKIWSDEFMKLLKCNEKELLKLNEKDKIKYILEENYKPVKARNLYNFYLSVLIDGLESVKNSMSSSSYYRNIQELKKSNIDFSQTFNIDFDNDVIDFNPFTAKEVA